MAETAYCLRRSFSNPSEINSLNYPSEEDPTHALGQSISFGRYTTESLDWEKWSAFNQNRYLEEAERYSKPGSVAKMKAYFEAHYGRFGAKKKAAQEQKNDISARVDAQDTPNIEVFSSSLAMNPEAVSITNINPSSNESPTKNNPNVGVLYGSSAQLKDEQNEAAGFVESVVIADVINCSLEVQVHSCEDAETIASVTEGYVEDNAKDVKENNIVCTAPKRKEKPETEKLDSMSEQKLADYSVKRSKKSSLSKLSSSLSKLASPIRRKKEGNDTPSSKVPKISSSLARLATPVRQRKEGQVTPSKRMLVKESIDKTKLPTNTLHNVSSDIGVKTKPSPAPRKAAVGKVITPLGKIIRDTFGSSSTPRASVNSVSQRPSATPQSAVRKSRVALEKSFDMSRRLDQKLKSTSTGNVKSSTHSPTTFASFSFRTEERAAKRREFFQKKLEQAAENLQPKDKAKSKVKLIPDSRKSSQSNLKGNDAAYVRTAVVTDSIKKIPLSRQPPKCEAKFDSDLARDKRFRPFQRIAGSQSFSEDSKTLSSTLMINKKKRHENASPNIL